MKHISKLFVIFLSLTLINCDKDNPAPNTVDPPVPNTEEPPIPITPDLGRMNLDFEIRSPYDLTLPLNWSTGGGDEGYTISLDNIEKYSGLYSLKMQKQGNRIGGEFGAFSSNLSIEIFVGKNVEYRGWIKTQGVKNGYAGLWFRVDGELGNLGFDNMNNRGLNGDNKWTQVSINMNVSNNAQAIVFGGLFPGEGIAWFDHLELFIDGEKYIDPEPKTSFSQEEVAALKKYIYPLRTYEPYGGDTKDLEVLGDLIGNSTVVALGENTHGSSEIYKMKNRIIQYLAVHKGFDIFSIEANMPEAYKLNNYTVRGEGDPKRLIAGMYFWTWRTEEVLNMVEWMRRFNQLEQRILFTGFDMQYYYGAIDELFDAFKGNMEVEIKIDELKKKLDKQAGFNEITPQLSFLQNSIDASSFQADIKEWLQQIIEIIQQYSELNRNTNAYLWRDRCMADNFIWIKENNPDSKFVIWAHNSHIMKTDNAQGYHLAQKLGDEYTTFGFTFSEGTYTAIGNKGLTSYEAIKAYPGSLEYLLNQLNEPIFILDLKKIKSDNYKDIEWLMEYLPFRRVGAGGGLSVEFFNRKIADDFDYLIFIKISSPSTLLEVQ